MDFQVSVALYLLVFVVIVVLLVRMARKARGDQAQSMAMADGDSVNEKLLLRFVDDQSGKRIGETVAVDGMDLIVKDGQTFLAVAVADVKEKEGGLILTKSIDESAARRKGDAWRERGHKVISYSDSELPNDDPEG